ncbi:hypothetical protein FHS16_003828 [Paenibacillus endophyticus]|uniref:Uncharacterized protein n=1 Tax=Paenibacillus endophyticus TaxID=1294268 RepID=A0A7W5C9R1_9BACL|nr:hypothetical protein [Paenibacillus endophyticus]MBB3153753.1 hypothetical protein [Paenibacillus endophyticus]
MLPHDYIAEKRWNEQEREWELRVKRGEFLDGTAANRSLIRRWLSELASSKKRAKARKRKKNVPNQNGNSFD